MFFNRFVSGFASGTLLMLIVGGAIVVFSDNDVESKGTSVPPTSTIPVTSSALPSSSTGVSDQPVVSSEGHDRTLTILVEDVINDNNTALVSEIFAPDYIGHLPSSEINWENMTIETYLELPILLHGAIPDLLVTPEILFVAGDWAAMRGTLTGTFRSELYDISPTREEVNVSFTSLYRFNAEHKIAEEWISYDTLLFVQQFGLQER
jgi:predicted ester cyclase